MGVMATIVFFGRFAVGNPVDLLINPEDDLAAQEAAMQRLGLDQPIPIQFLKFLGGLAQGDLGTSFVHNRPALELILSRLPATLELATLAICFAVVIGVPLGMLAGMRPHAPSSRLIMAGSIVGFSTPNFWQGLMLIMLFAVFWGVLPAGGRGETVDVLGVPLSFLTLDGLSHMILPAVNLAIFKISLVIRLSRAGTAEVALQGYVKYARARTVAHAHRRRARAEEHPHSRGHRAGARDRQRHRLRRGHRNRLRLTRHRQAADRQHRAAGIGPWWWPI